MFKINFKDMLINFIKFIYNFVFIFLSILIDFSKRTLLFIYKISVVSHSINLALMLRFSPFATVIWVSVFATLVWLWFIFIINILQIKTHINLHYFSLFITSVIFFLIPLIMSIYYRIKLKLKILFLFPSSKTALELIKIIVCPKSKPFQIKYKKHCYELHFIPTFLLKRLANKKGVKFDHQFLAEQLKQELPKIKKLYDKNVLFYGITNLSVPGLIIDANLNDQITVLEKNTTIIQNYSYGHAKKLKLPRLFILKYKD